MGVEKELMLDIKESFERLPRAPIVEAVIDIRAHAPHPLEEKPLRAQLEKALSDYRFLDAQRTVRYTFQHHPEEETPFKQSADDLGWKGLRFQSQNEKHIVQFNRDGFVFSRLAPYESWEQMYEEAMRLWREYVAVAQPVEIQRIGLRYINRIQPGVQEPELEDYLSSPPAPPKGLDLPFRGFMHQNNHIVPGHPYMLNIIKTVQPSETLGVGPGLILDIDAFTTQNFELDNEMLHRRLLEMRWLKNKAFSGSLTDKAMALFQ